MRDLSHHEKDKITNEIFRCIEENTLPPTLPPLRVIIDRLPTSAVQKSPPNLLYERKDIVIITYYFVCFSLMLSAGWYIIIPNDANIPQCLNEHIIDTTTIKKMGWISCGK